MADLNEVIARIRTNFSAKDAAREEVLRLSRELIRRSANAIRATHRGEWERAQEILADARSNLEALHASCGPFADLRFAGFVHDGEKEYAEACTTFAFIHGQPLPDPDGLSVGYAAYLRGLGEAVGELRRHILDRMRHGEMESCERFLETMSDIYDELVTMDFPDGITEGLRRTTDVVRGVLEKTRGDLTIALRQRQLEECLGKRKTRRGRRRSPSGDKGAEGP